MFEKMAAPPTALLDELATACSSVAATQQAVLASIFQLNAGVAHLRQHGVVVGEGLAGAEAESLLRQLPITTYADYQPLVQAALQAAKQGNDEAFVAAAAELGGIKPDSFCTTTGTSGASKLIPMHPRRAGEAFMLFGLANAAVGIALPELASGREVRLGWAAPVEELGNGVLVGAVTACGMHRMLAAAEKDPNIGRFMAASPSPTDAWRAPDAHTAAYLHFLFALRDRASVTSLSDGFAAGVLLAVNVLWEHREALLSDLADGGLGAAWDPERTARPLSPPREDVAARLSAQLGPDPDLAAELSQVFAAGRAGLLERLFPRLLAIKAIFTGSMAKYVPLIRVLAPNAVLLSLCYGATEGAFGVAADLVEYACLCRSLPPSLATPADQALSSAGSSSSGGGGAAGAAQAPDAAEQPGVGCDRSERAGSPCSVLPEAPGIAGFTAYSGEEPGQAPYILCPNYGVYYEFLPLDACSAYDEEQPEVLRLGELVVGQRYELVVTNCQGMMRYKMGDMLRCVGYFGSAPKVVVEGRLSQELNICGEKTPEPLLLAAVTSAADAVLPGGVAAIKDWAARECLQGGSGGEAGSYVFYWETDPQEDSHQAGAAHPSAAACAGALEAALAAPGSSYQRARAGGRLGPAQVQLVRPGAFAALREAALAGGASAGQYKPPVVLTKAEQVAVLEAHVLDGASA